MEIPLPGERFHRGIVIASTWISDEEDEPTALVLLLRHERPYYRVEHIFWDRGWQTGVFEDHPNINPATAAYADNGGDY